jgi:hypothetical protein
MKTLIETQEAMVSWLLSNTVITALVATTNGQKEIREIEWEGTKFTYPAVRVRATKITPTNTTCSSAEVELKIYVFSELPSSKEANNIASEIMMQLHGKSFSVTFIGGTIVRFIGTRVEQLGAIRTEDNQLWQSELTILTITS